MRHQWVWPIVAFLAIVLAFASLLMRASRDQALAVTKPKDLELIHTMRLALLAASEAQYAALIADDSNRTDATADRAVRNFELLLQAQVDLKATLPKQVDTRYMQNVEGSITKLHDLHRTLVTLLRQNTNRKAYQLATVDGLKLLLELDRETQAWIENDTATSLADKEFLTPLLEIRLSLFRIHALLIPHISESTVARMEQLESEMNVDEQRVQNALKQLAVKRMTPDKESWLIKKVAEYSQLKSKIIELSGANSNIRSESIALNEYRDAQLDCESALVELEKQIEAMVPIPVIPKGRQ